MVAAAAEEDLSATHSSSPDLMETPHAEAEFFQVKDMDELSKQLEQERLGAMKYELCHVYLQLLDIFIHVFIFFTKSA